jgi:hypothetical protein
MLLTSFVKIGQLVQKQNEHTQRGDFIYFFPLLEKKVGYKQSSDFYCG